MGLETVFLVHTDLEWDINFQMALSTLEKYFVYTLLCLILLILTVHFYLHSVISSVCSFVEINLTSFIFNWVL
jgi:hypothetical protein